MDDPAAASREPSSAGASATAFRGRSESLEIGVGVCYKTWYPTMKAASYRLACLGGAYGNLPALRACIADAREQGCDVLAFLGDAIGCCGHSDEVVDLIRAEFDVLVAGNHEQEAAAGSISCGCGYASPEDERIGCLAFEQAVATLSGPRRSWLGTWPDQRLLALGNDRILLCHGSPRQTNEFLYETTTMPDQCRAWLEQAGAAAMVCTHTGLPWIKEVPPDRLAINCGVVGKPDHDGDPAVHYAILIADAAGRRAEIRRVDYDHEAWAAQLDCEGIDRVFVEPLRTGIWRHGIDSLPEPERSRPHRPPPSPASP